MPYPGFEPGTFGSAADFPNNFTGAGGRRIAGRRRLDWVVGISTIDYSRVLDYGGSALRGGISKRS